MSPYTKDLKPISDISPYFKKTKNNSIVFTGESLEIRIPSKFSQYGYLIISDEISTLGVFDMIIDDEYHVGMNILGTITIVPSDTDTMTYDQIDYTVLYLKNSDVFIKNTKILKDPNVVYTLWSEWITDGRVPYYINYTNLLKMFENVKELTGQGIGVSRSVFEGIIAYLARDPKDKSRQYRLSNMKDPMHFVALSSVSEGPSGTLARLNGAYFRDQGLTAALKIKVTDEQPFENILRGIR